MRRNVWRILHKNEKSRSNPIGILVKEERRHPTRITRKTHKEWTQNTEISFLLYDLPVECKMRGFDLISSLRGYIRAIKKRVKPYMEGHPVDHEELISVANECISNPPRVWNIGELKDGNQDHQWAIKYPGKDIVSYTSY
jgi:hypothetical protein